MKTNKYIIVLISTALFSLTGCTDWLEQEPMSQVTTAVYFKNAEQFQNAANKLADEFMDLDVISRVTKVLVFSLIMEQI